MKKEFALLGISCNILKKKKMSNMLFRKFALSFPAHLREIILSVEILSTMPKETEKITLYSPYPDIPPVDMFIHSIREMIANKVSAIYARNKPRDVYAIYTLLKLGTSIDIQLIRRKLPKFVIKHSKKRF